MRAARDGSKTRVWSKQRSTIGEYFIPGSKTGKKHWYMSSDFVEAEISNDEAELAKDGKKLRSRVYSTVSRELSNGS